MSHPQPITVNRDSGTDRANGGWLRRLVRPHPRTFQHFPEEDKCPVCGTNDDGETVLIALDGTGDGNIAEAKPFHLACAVAQQYRQDMKIIYRHVA